tara:strand:- start:728 stop:2023 length:1296 start_codon:yes stop_codon:yes gene_type:complete
MKKLLLISLLILFSCSKEPEIPQYTLTVTANPSEGGLVNPQTGTYSSGQTVNIIASANDFFAFSNWTGSWNGSDSSFTITMDSNKNITANFEDLDIDNDLVLDSIDKCLNTPAGESVDQNGCGYSQLDDDNDGINNGIDQCPDTLGYLRQYNVEIDNNGCYINYAYLDENEVTVKAYPDSPVGKVTYLIHPLFENLRLWKIVDNSTHKSFEPFGTFSSAPVTTFVDIVDASSRGGFAVTWDFSNVKKIYYFGLYVDSYKSSLISEWDLSNVEDMYMAFYNSVISYELDLSKWDVSNVTNMKDMFGNLNKNRYGGYRINFTGWDVSKVTNMQRMFLGAAFRSDFSSWDVSSVKNMKSMFGGSTIKTINNSDNIGLANWDVSNVWYMKDIFNGFSSNNVIDLSNWDVSNVADICNFTDNPNIIPPTNFINCSD